MAAGCKPTLALLFAFSLLSPAMVAAQAVSDSDADPGLNLKVKPNICIAKRGQSECRSSMDVSWYGKQVGDYCLHSNLYQQALFCWQASLAGEYREDLVLSEDMDYWMSPLVGERRLATVTVKFAALKPHRRYPRRRSRLPWSIVK